MLSRMDIVEMNYLRDEEIELGNSQIFSNTIYHLMSDCGKVISFSVKSNYFIRYSFSHTYWLCSMSGTILGTGTYILEETNDQKVNYKK